MLMPIEHIDDWERRIARQDAFWERAVIDRPVCQISFPKQETICPWPPCREYPSYRDRWMDTDRVVQQALASAMNHHFLGDALPSAWPNLGPEVFSAFFGLEMEYTADTSWAIPVIHHWSDARSVRFSEDNFYWRKLLEMTDALLDAGNGRFYVGVTDIHPGGDAIAAFREPILLNTDLLTSPSPIKELLARVNEVYFSTIDRCHDTLSAADQAITTWLGIVSSKRWYVPSNDFSCMVSTDMFNEFFLPGIVDECRHLEASIYHLDGPGALHHLDALLSIEELNAIQWVYGAGNGRASDWLHVYKRCQEAGKGIQLGAHLDELECLIENLRPEGVHLTVSGLSDTASADAVLRRLSLIHI